MTPLKAIRKMCLECSNHSTLDVDHCAEMDCPLWPYRFGRKPRRNEDRKQVAHMGTNIPELKPVIRALGLDSKGGPKDEL